MENSYPDCRVVSNNPCKEVALHALLRCLNLSLFLMKLQEEVNSEKGYGGVTSPISKTEQLAG